MVLSWLTVNSAVNPRLVGPLHAVVDERGVPGLPDPEVLQVQRPGELVEEPEVIALNHEIARAPRFARKILFIPNGPGRTHQRRPFALVPQNYRAEIKEAKCASLQ
jgi:hypothetical protein